MNFLHYKSLIVTALFSVGVSVSFLSGTLFPAEDRHATGHGNPVTLKNKYDAWKQQYEQAQGAEILSVPMVYSRALFGQKNEIRAVAKLNLLDGEFNVKLKGLEAHKDYSIWLTGHAKTNHSQKVEKKLGNLSTLASEANFATRLLREQLADFSLDRIVLTAAEQDKATPALIAGSPNLFQRMYYSGQLWSVATIGQNLQQNTPENPAFSFLLPKPAFAARGETHIDVEDTFARQIALGRKLFVKETFDGNGRTCATCHREDNNHTIDPTYIAKLPQRDPLFVHENNPALAELENADLVRQLAIFKANLDGFDRPGVFRSAQHTLSLGLSMDKELPEKDPEVEFCEAMLGWSGDGSPGCGSLRLFATGAIIQHLPKSMDRVENSDYRLPTEAEADALEAYMLSLGRQTPWILENMSFNSPIAEAGKELFNTKPDDKSDVGTGECKGCHFQAGAISSSSLASGNRDTGIEALPNQLHRMIVPDVAHDGGFSDTERNDCGYEGTATCYGNKKFNMVDAFRVDTAPFFHNHSISTIEEAISFYNSDAFNNADDRVIKMEASTVVAIAQFLRSLSAVDNIDTVIQLLEQADSLSGTWKGRRLLKLAIADTEDAIQVLTEGKINTNPDALKWLQSAYQKEKRALKIWGKGHANKLMKRAAMQLANSRDEIVTEIH